MRRTGNGLRWWCVLAWLAGMGLPGFAHETLWVGSTADGKLGTVNNYLPLKQGKVSTDPAIPGFVVDHLEVVGIDPSHVIPGLVPASPGANLALEFLSASPGVRLYELGSTTPITPGGRFVFGGPVFYFEPIVALDPSATPGSIYSITVRAIDVSPNPFHAPSEPFTFNVSPVPEPSYALLFIAAAALLLPRRRLRPHAVRV